jgi:hypothetical protein
MAEGLVNATHKERLSQRDSEPTHLKGGTHDDLGGTGIDSVPNSVKIDAGKGVKGQDTSIIGAGQNSEKSHIGKSGTLGEGEEGDIKVKFDGDDDDDDKDDIDKRLDEYEDVKPVDVDIEVDDDDEDGDKKKNPFVKEDVGIDVEGSELRGDNEGKMEASLKAPEAAMNSGPNKVTEDEEDNDLPPWLKGKKKEVKEGEEIVIKPSGDDDKDEKKSDDGDDKGDEKNENPFAKKSEKVDEAVHIHIKRPNVKLMEAAGIPAKAQKKVALIFETVIKDVTVQVSKQVAAHYKKLHESKLAKRDAVLAKQMDAYLNYVVEEWVKTNRVPVRTALKSQLAEEFLGAFQKLMKEHYIDVPEGKVDVVKTLSKQVAVLKKSLTEQVSQKLKLRQIAEAANKARIVAQFCKNGKLSEAQSAKLEKLAEGTQYTNSADFREKVGMLAESYFGSGKKPVAKVSGTEGIADKSLNGKRLTEETIQEDGKKGTGDPDVQLIADTLKRQSAAAKW